MGHLHLLDIIIVNYNSTNFLIKCLESVYEAIEGFSAKIFVQDNHSIDGVERVKTLFPDVKLDIRPTNIGFSAAINRALGECTGKYVILLNPDSLVTKDCFKNLISYLDKNPSIGGIGPKILNSDGTVQGSARSFPTLWTALFGRSSFLTRCFPTNPISCKNILTLQSDGKTPLAADWLSGACMMLRRSAICDTGFLDERFFMYWEDADLCKRLWNKGWKIVYAPQATVIHFVGGSSEKSPFRPIFEFHKSSFKLFNKYASKPVKKLLSPFVVAALALRMVFLFVHSYVTLKIRKNSSGKSAQKASLFQQRDNIHVLRIISRLNIGGPSIHVYLLTTRLDRGKFQSNLISGKISPGEGDMSYLFKFSDIKPVYIPELQREISFLMDIRASFHILKKIFRDKPDIVHSHTAKAGFNARLAVFLYNLFNIKKIRNVHTFHGHIFDGYYRKTTSMMLVRIERLLSKFTDIVIAISSNQKKDLSERFRIAPADKIRKVELGLDLEPFLNCKTSKGEFRRRLGIDNNTFLIGIIGRLVSIKNHLMFFRALKICLESNPEIKIKSVVVGDGELKKKIEHFCLNQNLSEHVIFCGWIQEIPKVYADLDVLALTSSNEGTPVSIIEAMASCVPVIATNVGGVSDLIGNPLWKIPSNSYRVCERGILCRKNDDRGFANALSYLIRNRAREENGSLKEARKFAKERFSKERLVQDMESIYYELLN